MERNCTKKKKKEKQNRIKEIPEGRIAKERWKRNFEIFKKLLIL